MTEPWARALIDMQGASSSHGNRSLTISAHEAVIALARQPGLSHHSMAAIRKAVCGAAKRINYNEKPKIRRGRRYRHTYVVSRRQEAERKWVVASTGFFILEGGARDHQTAPDFSSYPSDQFAHIFSRADPDNEDDFVTCPVDDEGLPLREAFCAAWWEKMRRPGFFPKDHPLFGLTLPAQPYPPLIRRWLTVERVSKAISSLSFRCPFCLDETHLAAETPVGNWAMQGHVLNCPHCESDRWEARRKAAVRQYKRAAERDQAARREVREIDRIIKKIEKELS